MEIIKLAMMFMVTVFVIITGYIMYSDPEERQVTSPVWGQQSLLLFP
jgi:Ni,Fe-hydrogenase I cytochrome b subunit